MDSAVVVVRLRDQPVVRLLQSRIPVHFSPEAFPLRVVVVVVAVVCKGGDQEVSQRLRIVPLVWEDLVACWVGPSR